MMMIGNMKEILITFRGIPRILHYELKHDEWGTETCFYEGLEEVTTKKYWLWGEKTTKLYPKHIFTLFIDVEDNSFTKNEIRSRIERHLELLNRTQEIEHGIII